MKKLLALLLSLSMVMGLLAVPTFAESGFDNLNNEAGELVIGFLGGSITVADGDSNSMGLNRYATRVTEWFQEQYPEKTVTQVNAGIGGTGSDLGKYRVMTDIGAYAPDVVFVEYAVNDADYSSLYSETVRSNMETIVRSLQSLPKVPVIVFLYSMHDNSYSNIRYTSIPDHQDVADYYGIESINFYEYMSDLVEKGDFIWDKNQSGSLTSDNIHPNALGHEQYGNYIISQLESRDILHENNTNLPRKFMFSTKNTRDIKFADEDSLQMTGTWEDGVAGQSDNKYEAIQATAAGDTVSFTYESAGNDTLGVTLIGGTGTWVLDEGTENELTGELSGANNNLPIVKKFVEGLSAGTHTVKITNTDGLKLGRIIADGGVEVNAASVAENGDYIPASMPKNLIINCQVPNFAGQNDGNVSYTALKDDYTSNGDYTTIKMPVVGDVAAGGNWGIHGINIAKASAESHKGILYDNYTATAGTYVFKTRVRAVAGNPTVGATTVKSYVPTYDAVYGKTGFAPSDKWEDYKTILTPPEDGFTVSFGVLDGKAGDVLGWNPGDGVYYAPEVAYDVAVEIADEKKTLFAGATKTLKAEVLNQIGIKAHSADQSFTWSIIDENGDEVDGVTITPIENSNEATIVVDEDAELGTYYVKAVATAYNWQKTLPVEVEVNTDPFAKDHVPGAIPANLTEGGSVGGTTANWSGENIPDEMKEGSSYPIKISLSNDRLTGVDGNWYVSGIFLKDKNKNETSQSANAFKVESNKNYVFSIKAKSVKGNVRVGLANNKAYGGYIVADHGREGVQVGTDWTNIKTAISIGDTSSYSMNYLSFGIVTGEAEDYIVYDVPSIYLAEEVPHSITLEGIDGTSIMTGTDAEFESQILNQLGLPGYLDQSAVTFTVGDNLGNEVDGLTVASDGNIATVSASIDVPAGEYYLRANYAIDENTTWRKTVAVTVTENTDPYARDHVPSATIPANLTEGGSVGGTTANWSGQNLPENMTAGSNYAIKIGLYSDRLTGVDSNWYASGIFLKDRNKNEDTQSANAFKPEANKNYVFSVKAKSVEGNVRVGLAKNNGYGNFIIADHGREGVQIGTDWTDFKTAISIGDISQYSMNYLSFGIVTGAAADYVVYDVPSVYLAEEVPHSLTLNGVDGTEMVTGDKAEFEAQILNQLDLPGYLDQNAFTFTVGDAKGNPVEGLTVTSEGNVATVAAADDVPAGEYYLRANYAVDEETTWRKTLAITVKTGIANSKDFSQPEKPRNLTTQNQSGGSNGGNWSSAGIPDEMKEGSVGVATRLFLGADKEKPDANYYAYGIFIADRDKVANPENTTEASKRFMVNANTDYVFEVKAKSVEGGARIGIASSYNWGRYITGDHGAEGFEVGTDWTDFKTSISIGDTSSWSFNRFSFGIVTGTVDNFVVVDPASFYLAEEVAYEFNVDASAESVEQGKSIDLDATLLNQSGREGYLSQEFTWVAITDDRTEYLDGFTFEANAEDASKTTLTVAEDVAPGEYLIVAQNAEEGVAKHYRLTVTEAAEEPEVPVEFAVTDVEIGSNTVTVSFEGIPEGGKNVVLYVAKYLGGVFNGAEVKPITLTGENATESKPESFTKAEGETVKAFIWNPDMTALLETPATN